MSSSEGASPGRQFAARPTGPMNRVPSGRTAPRGGPPLFPGSATSDPSPDPSGRQDARRVQGGLQPSVNVQPRGNVGPQPARSLDHGRDPAESVGPGPQGAQLAVGGGEPDPADPHAEQRAPRPEVGTEDIRERR